MTSSVKRLIPKSIKQLLLKFSHSIFHSKINRPLSHRGLKSPLIPPMTQIWQSSDLNSHYTPENYIEEDESTHFLFEDILKVADKDFSFLDFGCNSGRNLNYLLKKGFKNLSGIDISRSAIEESMPKYFPELAEIGTFYIGEGSEQIKKVENNSIDVVFAKSCLIHIEPKNNSVFEDMARISRKYIITFGQENAQMQYNYNFTHMLEKYGFKEVLVKRIFRQDDSIHHGIPTKFYTDQEDYFSTMELKVFIKRAD